MKNEGGKTWLIGAAVAHREGKARFSRASDFQTCKEQESTQDLPQAGGKACAHWLCIVSSVVACGLRDPRTWGPGAPYCRGRARVVSS